MTISEQRSLVVDIDHTADDPERLLDRFDK